MKRKIKLRYWNKFHECMIDNVGYHPEIDFNLAANPDFNYTQGSPGSRIVAPPYSDQFLMQFTGVKDKNGVEVFEGDVIADSEENYEVLFGEYIYDGATHTGFYTRQAQTSYIGPLDSSDGKVVEVIGNIYQQPHLITAPGTDTGKQ